MKTMTAKEINEQTRGKGLSSAQVVYKFTKHAYGIAGDGMGGATIVTIEIGDLVPIYGCGELDEKKNSSLYNVDGKVTRIGNGYCEHYANPILEEAPYNV